MIQMKIAKDLSEFRAHGQKDQAKILAIVLGEMQDFARRTQVDSRNRYENDPKNHVLNDGDANDIIKRHLRHAGITLQMNQSDPTALLVLELVSKYLVGDVMGDTEMRERIVESGLSKPRDILRHLNSFGPAVDMSRARDLVRTVFGG